ncbi:FtsX-like permease family protein [Streptosporangiaceae bacterium NEAU-GS5]|nr:FtsX-like permease family protein [Streptosporangiaceae bacterium NEAU-GS5]
MTIIWMRLELRRRWRSLVALALLLSFATATVLTSVAGARRGMSAVDRLLAVSLPATIIVLPNQPGFDWAAVRRLPQVAAMSLFPVIGFTVDEMSLADQGSAFPPVGDDILRTIEKPVLLEGRVFDPAKIDEVVVSPTFLTTYHKKLGDHLTLRLTAENEVGAYQPTGVRPHGPVIDVHIVGVIRSPWYSERIGEIGGVLPSPALFARYPKNFVSKDTYVNAMIRLEHGDDDLPAFREGLAAVSKRTDIDIWSQRVRFAEPAHRVNDFEASSLLAFGLAALLAALVLVGQTVARYAAATTAELRLLRPVGMTPRQTMVNASAAPFLAAIVAATAGVAAAVVASNWMPIGAAARLEPAPGIDVDWLVLGVGWLLVPVLVVAGSAASVAFTLSAANRDGPARRSAVALAAARLGLPVPIQVGTRFALEPGRGRSAVPVRPALVGAVAGVLGTIAAFTFSAGVVDAAGNPQRFGQTHAFNAWVGMNGQDFGEAAALMRATSAVPAVAAINDGRMAVAESGKTSATLYTYAPAKGRYDVVLTSGRVPARDDQVVLAPTTAVDMGVVTGDSVTLTGRGGATGRFTVSGIGFVPIGSHNDYAQGGWVTAGGYERLFGTFFKFHVIEFTLKAGVDAEAAGRQIQQAALPLTGADEPLELEPSTLPPEAHEIEDVQILPLVLGGFLTLLAIGAVGHALATAVRRRRHEVAVLRAVGLTRTQARWAVVTQAAVLALTGLIVGIPLGLALGRTLWRIAADRTPLYYEPPWAVWAVVLIGPAAILIAGALAAWPGHLAARLRIGHVLRTE